MNRVSHERRRPVDRSDRPPVAARPSSGRGTAALAEDLAPDLPDGVEVEIDVTWHNTLTAIDCGGNLEQIGCPHCGAWIDTEWYADLLESHCEDGFVTLAVEVPCCDAATSLDVLDYDWPCAFARCEIAIWNPDGDWFGDEELAALGDALGTR